LHCILLSSGVASRMPTTRSSNLPCGEDGECQVGDAAKASDDLEPVCQQRFVGHVLQQRVMHRVEMQELQAVAEHFRTIADGGNRSTVADDGAGVDAHRVGAGGRQHREIECDFLAVRWQGMLRMDAHARHRDIDDAAVDRLGFTAEAADPRRDVGLDPRRAAQAGALDRAREGQVDVEQGAPEHAFDGTGEGADVHAREHADRDALAVAQRDRRAILHRHLDDDVLVLDVANQGGEMLNGLDLTVRDELQPHADLQVHGFELEFLGFEFVNLAVHQSGVHG